MHVSNRQKKTVFTLVQQCVCRTENRTMCVLTPPLVSIYIEFVCHLFVTVPFCIVESEQLHIRNKFRMAHATLLASILIAVLGMLITDSTAADADPREEISLIPGGYTPVDVNDPIVKEIAAFAAVALSVSQNAGQLELILIIKAEVQVVAGVNFKLTLKLVTVSSYYPKSLICQVIVFEQPWTNTREVTQSICK